SRVRRARGRRVRQLRAGARRAGACVGADAALAARRAEARRGRSAGVPTRHVGRGAADSVRELYSPVGSIEDAGGVRRQCPSKESALVGVEAIAHTQAQKTAGVCPLVASIPVEYASERRIRERNKLYYRFNHWPIWIFVFFIAPGPLTFDLFEAGFDARMALWLGAVLVGTGVAGLRGRLPGVEPKPYIIRFTEDRPNPLYRRVCYTFACIAVITFEVLYIAGLFVSLAPGRWYLRQIYRV